MVVGQAREGLSYFKRGDIFLGCQELYDFFKIHGSKWYSAKDIIKITKMNFRAVYPALNKLVRADCLDVRLVNFEDGHKIMPKRIYRLKPEVKEDD